MHQPFEVLTTEDGFSACFRNVFPHNTDGITSMCIYVDEERIYITKQQAMEFFGLIEAPVVPITHVHTIPDHCDRYVWRGRYYHLPVESRPLTK